MANEMTMAVPRQLTNHSMSLPQKPDAPVEYSVVPASSPSRVPSLLVFLNGLMLPQAAWMPVISRIVQERPSYPAMLTYDRYGQGRTISRDPVDKDKEPGHGHDFMDVVHDLQQLIEQCMPSISPNAPPRLIFVANSIGCPIARLYAQAYPGTVGGIIMLDSNIANSDLVSIFPDPDGPGFDAQRLPDGVTAESLRDTRRKFEAIFHPDVTNAEGLCRRSVPELLPFANSPVLHGYGGKPPLLTVVGHDPEHFAQESESGSMATPMALSMNYMNPAWHRYNECLVEIAGDRGRGPITAKDCGHFIQRDDPAFVANLISDMLDELEDEEDVEAG